MSLQIKFRINCETYIDGNRESYSSQVSHGYAEAACSFAVFVGLAFVSDNGLLVDDELATDYRNLPESGSAYQADSVEREWREPRYPVARARHTISPLTGDILFTFGP